jgi:hypothetical protein
VDDKTRAERVATLRKYAADLARTAESYRTAAGAPGLRGGYSGQVGTFLRGEANRLESEAKTVARQADEWEDELLATTDGWIAAGLIDRRHADGTLCKGLDH